MNASPVDSDIPQRAVSLYSQNEGMDDFPVLKAFQQYIDAEQEKARKRMFVMGGFFAVILFIVIAVFMMIIYGINQRNQALGDRLVEYAMKQSERHDAVQPQPVISSNPAQDAALKAMTETLVGLQKKMAETEARTETASRPVPVATHEDTHEIRSQALKLEQEKARVEAEKKRLEAEKERLHQIEIEQQRRKLYPECYEDGAKTSTQKQQQSPSRARMLTDEDIREILREAYPESESADEQKPKAKKSAPPEAKRETEKKTPDAELENDDGAIEYFKDDNYTIPIDVKGSGSKVKFTVPVE